MRFKAVSNIAQCYDWNKKGRHLVLGGPNSLSTKVK